jgi:hypothetical protein
MAGKSLGERLAAVPVTHPVDMSKHTFVGTDKRPETKNRELPGDL